MSQKLYGFDVISKLGSGSFSEVFKVRRQQDGQIYAMKQISMGLLKEKERQNALNEIRILASLDQQYIIGYKEAFFNEHNNNLCIIMEYAEEGDILQLIKQHIKNSTFFDEEQIWKALVHMTYGLKTLHDQKILHRDLKCANIFCSKDFIYKIGDLNVSKIAERGLVYTQTGTPYYASPEVWRDDPYDSKSDIWSLGCILYEMAALKPPFTGKNMAGNYAEIPSRYSYGLKQIISQLLRMNSSQRPGCDQILSNAHLLANASQFLQNGNKTQSPIHLLKTIKLPKSMKGLNDNLPGKNYKENRTQMPILRLGDRSKPLLDLTYYRQKRKEIELQMKDLSQISCILNDKQIINLNQINLKQERQITQLNSLDLQNIPIQKYIVQSPRINNKESNIKKRIQRINSVRDEPPIITRKNILIQNQQFRPSSHHMNQKNKINQNNNISQLNIIEQDDQSQLAIKLDQKQQRLLQPLSKQYSDQTPLKKNTIKKEYPIEMSNLPYLGDYYGNKLLQSEKENVDINNLRKISPYQRPKIALPVSSPFQLDRKRNVDYSSKQRNKSMLNDNQFFD